jgi:hypothetical protein
VTPLSWARSFAILAAAAILAAPPAAVTARADEGRASDACTEAPSALLPGGTTPADFGAVADPCGGSDLMLRARGAFLIASEMPDYYGSITAGGLLRARRRITARSWLSMGLDAVTYRYVNNAGLASRGASFGPATLGVHRTLHGGDRHALAGYARALLPLDTARVHGVEMGLELGISGRQVWGGRAALVGGLSVTTPLDIVAGQAHGRLEPGGAVELWYAPGPRLGLFAGATGRFVAGPETAFITAVPRAGARFALGRRLWSVVLVELPVAGRDRTDLVASLFVGYAP